MSVPTIFDGEESRVPEGSSHQYQCEFREESGAALQAAAIQTITAWLDDQVSGNPINSRTAVNVKNAGGGALVDGPAAVPPRPAGVGVFTWTLDAADAPIVSAGPVESEQHRITLKVTFNRTGGGTGTLTQKVLYRVVALERIP